MPGDEKSLNYALPPKSITESTGNGIGDFAMKNRLLERQRQTMEEQENMASASAAPVNPMQELAMLASRIHEIGESTPEIKPMILNLFSQLAQSLSQPQNPLGGEGAQPIGQPIGMGA
ncbi:MAG: hypothetical protein SV062_08085 [Thermodesulfobacteriota bacterium]|nr:hypothetical protein [Thermodesulfobacteriota bacterium]